MTAEPNEASAHNDRGRGLADQELYDKAIEEYRKADELWQKDQSKDRKLALRNWADALREQEHYEQAAEKCQKAISVDPEYADAYLQLGRVLADQELFDQAIKQYRQADEKWQKDRSHKRKLALYYWGDALRWQGDYKKAAEKCQEAIGIDPEYPEAYNGLGRVRAGQGCFDEAIEQYRQADEKWQKKKPKDRKIALRYWADALWRQGYYEQAAEKCQDAIRVDPDDPWAYHCLGDVFAARERFDDAIAQYRQADEKWQKKKSKRRKIALRDWANALGSQKHYEQAAEKCREAIRVDPDDPWAYDYLGDVFAAQERFDEAIEQYREANERWQKKASKDRKIALRDWAGTLHSQKYYKQAFEKFREAIRVDPDDPWTYNFLGNAFAAQERFDEAIEQFREADERLQKKESKDRKFALWNWGQALRQQERFDEAIDKFACAAKIVPQDTMAIYRYGHSLAEPGRYRDALAQFDKASLLDQDDPLPRHSKAHFLFQLGRYEEGWKEWRAARQCYERALDGKLRADQLWNAINFAGVLGEIFTDYEKSEGFYQRVLERQDDIAEAWAGRAILFQQWANSDAKAPAEIYAQLSYLVRRASELLKRQLGKGSDFQTFLSLADLYIETCDWTEAREQLDLAASVCGGSRLKRAKVTTRRGLVCYRLGEHAEAVKNFRQALLVKPADLTLRSNLGNALLQLKQFETAQDEFARVLNVAPGNIDALCGAAQVRIELADDGDPDQYGIAVAFLSDALKYGRNQESGSKRLENTVIARIYYGLGYARIKSYEADVSRPASMALREARRDFQQCKDMDPNDSKARAAIEKITKFMRRRMRESLLDVWGPFFIFFAGAAVFLFAQLDFLFQRTTLHPSFWVPPEGEFKGTTAYITLTFGSLLFMVAGLSLPKVLKLKVAGIELEKASVDQVSAPSPLGVSRSKSLIEITRSGSLTD